MRIDVFEQATSDPIHEELEMPCAPQIGSVLQFDYSHGLPRRYRVVAIEHRFSLRYVGEAVKEPETTHESIVCFVENC